MNKSIVRCRCGHQVLAKEVLRTDLYERRASEGSGREYVYVKFRCRRCKRMGEAFVAENRWDWSILEPDHNELSETERDNFLDAIPITSEEILDFHRLLEISSFPIELQAAEPKAAEPKSATPDDAKLQAREHEAPSSAASTGEPRTGEPDAQVLNAKANREEAAPSSNPTSTSSASTSPTPSSAAPSSASNNRLPARGASDSVPPQSEKLQHPPDDPLARRS